MRVLLITIAVLFSISTWAQKPKVVLLTSLMETQILSRSRNAKLEVALEKKFRGYFKTSDLQLEVHHLTKPETLWKTLNDPQVVGLIWVSHAKKAKALTANLNDPATVMDAFGNDVKGFFRRITSNLRFLALIGCEGEDVLKQFEDEGAYHKRPDFMYKAFSEKVDAKMGLASSLKVAKSIIQDDMILEEEIQEESHHLSFRVKSAVQLGRLKIEIGGEVLGVVSSDKMLFNLPVSIEAWNKLRNRNIKVTALKDGTTNQVLPSYEIQINGLQDLWKIFEKNGVAIGSGQNLYLWQIK